MSKIEYEFLAALNFYFLQDQPEYLTYGTKIVLKDLIS